MAEFRYSNVEKEKEVWLDTQTWSYKAIGLYLDLGFIAVKKDVFNSARNEFDQAVPILEKHMNKELFRRFIETAE